MNKNNCIVYSMKLFFEEVQMKKDEFIELIYIK